MHLSKRARKGVGMASPMTPTARPTRSRCEHDESMSRKRATLKEVTMFKRSRPKRSRRRFLSALLAGAAVLGAAGGIRWWRRQPA